MPALFPLGAKGECAATMFSASWAITAAHCVEWEADEAPLCGRGGDLVAPLTPMLQAQS